MSSRSAVNQDCRPLSAGPDTVTFDSRSVKTFNLSKMSQRAARHLTAICAFAVNSQMMKFSGQERVGLKVRELSTHKVLMMCAVVIRKSQSHIISKRSIYQQWLFQKLSMFFVLETVHVLNPPLFCVQGETDSEGERT